LIPVGDTDFLFTESSSVFSISSL